MKEGGESLPDCTSLEFNRGARENGSSDDLAFFAAVHNSLWDGCE
jgi:hypothetical protein